ncbi:fungal-specific transcription factor domain-containing protein [Aspergillus spinulosporus]
MPIYKTSNPRKRVKSRAGCQTCKQRRIKCDMNAPSCSPCEKKGLACPGYKRDVKWSDKHELLRRSWASQGQPFNEAHSAWFVEGAVKLRAAIASSHRSSRTAKGTLSESADMAPVTTDCLTTRDARETLCISSAELYREDGIDRHPRPSLCQESVNDTLLRYYFSQVCGILSAFDSPQNPLRSLVAGLIPSYPALLHSVLSMSSAHLHQSEKDRTVYSLELRIQAISQLASHISEVTGAGGSALATSSTTALVLSSIVLGMTSTWHEVSSLELVHLQGARVLFKQWISNRNRHCIGPSPYHPNASFLVGVMAYWEALASFHVDQDLEAVDYLWDICNKVTIAEPGCPNPLTGISTSLFISLAKVGVLTRQLRLVNRTCALPSLNANKREMYCSLLERARDIEKCVRSYVVMPAGHIHATGDPLTPSSHLHTMDQVYQLSILAELYRLFPELLRPSELQFEYNFNSLEKNHLLGTLATKILTLLSSIPPSSRTKAIQILPLIIAGSALQGQTFSSINISSMPLGIQGPSQGIVSLSDTDAVAGYWRRVVIDKITNLYDYVGLESVAYAKRIVQGVWMRADSISSRGIEACFPVSWLDVMREEKLQTFFG